MSDAPAVIMGSLVKMASVGTHKSVVLSIHVPEEAAEQVIAAFGYPTGSRPVAVVVARLVEGVEPVRGPEPEAAPLPAPKPLREVRRRTLAEKAAMMCAQKGFQDFVWDSDVTALAVASASAAAPQESTSDWFAAEIVRRFCGVKSRAELNTDPAAAERFNTLLAEYELHQRSVA